MDIAIIISYLSLFFLIVSSGILIYMRKDHFIYSHRLFFVIGLAFSGSLTNNAIITSLTWYFTYYGDDLAKSAILTNIRGSLSSIFVIFMAHAADSCIGRFKTLLLSNIAYVGALVLFWMFHPYDVNWFLVVSLVLLAVGTSGDKLLQDVLGDLVNDIYQSHDQNQTRSTEPATIWSCILYTSGAASAILWVAPDAIGGVPSSWNISFFICIITMTLASIIFVFGQACFKKLLKDISGYITIFSRQDKSRRKLDIEKGENEGVTQDISTSELETKGKEDKKNITSYKPDVSVLKSLLRMFPMWGMFLVLSLISATGSAFFLQQYNNLNAGNDIAVQIYSLVQELSSFVIRFLYCRIKCLGKKEKVKIGVGMLCGILSCIFAWQLEVYRLMEVSYLVDEDDANTSISFLWLVPQFCLLGCMEGLTGNGLLKFYKSQIKVEQLQGYREEYIEFVMGLGKLLNIFLILLLKGWFGDTINDSRLDKYYLVLVCVGSANFISYCCIARLFYKDQELTNPDQQQDNQDMATDDSQDQIIEQLINMEQSQDSGDTIS